MFYAHQAIFDAILVYLVNIVSPSGKWQQLQQQMCAALGHTLGYLRLQLGYLRLQPRIPTVAAWVTYGCTAWPTYACCLCYLRLQPGSPTVAAFVTYGCRCDSLNRKKDANTLAILDSHYSDINVFFVQVRARVRVRIRVRVSQGWG